MSVAEVSVPRKKRGELKENKHDKFRRLVVKRLMQMKKYARLVKNCASYEFTEAEKEKVMTEVFRMAHEIKAAFENAGKAGPKRDEFSF